MLPLICPCDLRSQLKPREGGYECQGNNCIHSSQENFFRFKSNIPIIVSEEYCDTVCNSENIASYIPRTPDKFDKLKILISGKNRITAANCNEFVRLVMQLSTKPKVLVIGSGKKGNSTDDLWGNGDIEIHGVDIYASATVDLICDAHYLPLENDYYDGVWIQAVLEHVVDPNKVTSEIHRVLKFSGIVYAETPFMQQVHEGAYDFTRFTTLGHRYLFRNFKMISIGGTKGPEIALAWSIRYFVLGLTRSKSLAKIFGVISELLLRPLGCLISRASMYDSPSGVFFLGSKSKKIEISHKDLITLYQGDI